MSCSPGRWSRRTPAGLSTSPPAAAALTRIGQAPDDLIAQSVGVNNYVRAAVSAGTISLNVRGLGHDQDIDSLVLAPLPQI